MESYTLVKVPADGVAVLRHPKYGQCLWTKVKLRKVCECVVCESPMTKGGEAFSPLTNGYNRMHRICMRCISKLDA